MNYVVLQVVPIVAMAALSLSSENIMAQTRGPGSAPSVVTGSSGRSSDRDMDDYDREIDRLRKNGRALSQRRAPSAFPQINEDFKRLQSLHNDLMHLTQADTSLELPRLSELANEMRKRAVRLKTNLALPNPEDDKGAQKSAIPSDTEGVKTAVLTLHGFIVSFVKNPIFQNLGVLDAKLLMQAGRDLKQIILMSGELRDTAKLLMKPGRDGVGLSSKTAP